MFANASKLSSYLCLVSIAWLIGSTPALAHNITFSTDYLNPAAGPGVILDQSTMSASRIFQYTEDDVYATAIRNTDPESHYHLFGNGIVIGGDSEGVNFTFGGPTPTTAFNVENLEVLELGDINTYFTPFMGSIAGPRAQVTSTGLFNFDPNAWSGISHFSATFEDPRPTTGRARLVFQNLDVHQASTAPVPEPGTIGLFGIGLAGLGLMRYRKNAKAK